MFRIICGTLRYSIYHIIHPAPLSHTCRNQQKEDTAPVHALHAGSIVTWELLSPDAAICWSYFINVLLTIIGLKAAKLHIMNCNKLRA